MLGLKEAIQIVQALVSTYAKLTPFIQPLENQQQQEENELMRAPINYVKMLEDKARVQAIECQRSSSYQLEFNHYRAASLL